MATYIPPGWPTGVHPPGSDDFEATAIAWLLEVVPPDYRLHGVLRRYPLALAAMARHHTAACVEGPARDTAPRERSSARHCRHMPSTRSSPPTAPRGCG